MLPDPLVADPDLTLYLGDALDVLPGLPDRSVDAIVTSPPYLDARDDVDTVIDRLEYGDWAASWLHELARILKRGGSLMLNLGRLHRDGVEVDWAQDVVARARAVGWKKLDEIVWHKVNGGGGRSSPYLIDRHEYVFWLALRVDPYKGFDEARVPYSPATLGRYQRRWAGRGAVVKAKDGAPREGREPHPDGAKPGTVFVSSVGAEKGIQHPTPMAPELAAHLIKLACPPGGVVLDPFAGSGTTGVEARKLGRMSVLIELDAMHADEAARRLAQQALPLASG
jgi:site-specific DNA-methyltransferase (adenine-specific)